MTLAWTSISEASRRRALLLLFLRRARSNQIKPKRNKLQSYIARSVPPPSDRSVLPQLPLFHIDFSFNISVVVVRQVNGEEEILWLPLRCGETAPSMKPGCKHFRVSSVVRRLAYFLLTFLSRLPAYSGRFRRHPSILFSPRTARG